MPVELRKVKDNNAISYFQVALVEKPTEPIGEILSEGEHRCIALAAALAPKSLPQAQPATATGRWQSQRSVDTNLASGTSIARFSVNCQHD
jgi:hypothetical protein